MRTHKLMAALACGLLAATQALAVSPDEQPIPLLKALQPRQYDGSLVSFHAGSLTARQKATALKVMEGQVKAAMDFVGPPSEREIVESRPMGKDIVNLKLLSMDNDDSPMFWNATFYRRNDA